MALTLAQHKACADMAELLYRFLPGSGSSRWPGHVTFRTVAEGAGVGEFWQSGSKKTAITNLLSETLQHKRGQFQRLVENIVKAGLNYTASSSAPVTRDEIERLNALLRKVDFQFPELLDQAFLSGLPTQNSTQDMDRASTKASQFAYSPSQSRKQLMMDDLRQRFYGLTWDRDRQKAGRELQTILYEIFVLEGLGAGAPFRVIGEEIDGSFVLDNEIYLIEAKWEKDPSNEADLLVFQGKIDGKSSITRGLFLSIFGVSEQALAAIRIGKSPRFVIADASDLIAVLEGRIQMADLIRRKVRMLAERGVIYAPSSTFIND